MKLLILTQKVDINDPILGFFHRWIEEFANNCQSVLVICLEKGECRLPANVRVLSLGKELGVSKLKYIFNFYRYILRERKNYDSVFVHMNPIYLCLGGIYWRSVGKKIGLWYVHRSVDLKLRIAEKFSNIIFTLADESFRLKSNKVSIVGHGIDLSNFTCEGIDKPKIFQITYVGRISPVKNCETLIEASNLLKQKLNIPFKIIFVGAPTNSKDEIYFDNLKKVIENSNLEENVQFAGAVSNKEVRNYYCHSDICVNMTESGGVDKTVIESMACGVPAIVCNKAFRRYFGEYSSDLVFEERNADDLFKKILAFIDLQKRTEYSKIVFKIARDNFDLKKLIPSLIKSLNG